MALGKRQAGMLRTILATSLCVKLYQNTVTLQSDQAMQNQERLRKGRSLEESQGPGQRHNHVVGSPQAAEPEKGHQWKTR